MTSAFISNDLIYRTQVASGERIKNTETQIQLLDWEKRIDSAKDDAGVVSISNDMNATVKSMLVTRVNLQDGVSKMQGILGNSGIIARWLNQMTKVSHTNIVDVDCVWWFPVALEKLRPVGATSWSGADRRRVVG